MIDGGLGGFRWKHVGSKSTRTPRCVSSVVVVLRQRVRRTDGHQDGGEAKAPHDMFPVHAAPAELWTGPGLWESAGHKFVLGHHKRRPVQLERLSNPSFLLSADPGPALAALPIPCRSATRAPKTLLPYRRVIS
jgi:hypothetical protein